VSNLFNLNAFYDQIAPLYGWGWASIPLWQRYTEAVLPSLPESGRVLEVGPGPGLLLEKLISRCDAATGIDLSRGMLEEAKRRLQRAGRPAPLVRGNALRLPFPDGAFDGVVTTFALSAIPDGQTAVDEMARVLRRPDPSAGQPGGVLALVDAGYPGDGNLLGTALARLWELGGDQMRDEAAMMEAAGLQVVLRHEFGVGKSIRLVVGRKDSYG
jgi:ubiquinone/menaquinone biosynthesis C-methylase UbiE